MPNDIREAWKDVYVLFDVSYSMNGSAEDWQAYWDKANKLIQKYGDSVPLLELLESVAHMIETFVKRRENTLLWGKDEDYPYPKQ